jgi:hypothetical protein
VAFAESVAHDLARGDILNGNQIPLGATILDLAQVAAPHLMRLGLVFLPVLLMVARGQAIRRSADGQQRNLWLKIWTSLLFIVVPLATLSYSKSDVL